MEAVAACLKSFMGLALVHLQKYWQLNWYKTQTVLFPGIVILFKRRKICYRSPMFFRLHFKFQDQCDCPQMLPAGKASLSLPQLLFSFLIKMFQMGGFLLSFYFLLLILTNATQTLSIPFIVYVGAVQLWACYQSWLYLSAKCFRNSFQPSSRFLTLFSFQKEDCFSSSKLALKYQKKWTFLSVP